MWPRRCGWAMHISRGNTDAADRLFAEVIRACPRRPRPVRRRPRRNEREPARVDQLTATLTLEPQATGIHYPAMAYRALGNVAQSEAISRCGARSIRDRPIADARIDVLLRVRACIAARARRRFGRPPRICSAKGSSSRERGRRRQRYGTALYQMGDKRGAAQQFEEVFARRPTMPARIQPRRAAERRRLPRRPSIISRRAEVRSALRRSAHPAGRGAGRTGRLAGGRALADALQTDPANGDAAFGRAWPSPACGDTRRPAMPSSRA
jgi:hypothetical protein